MKYFKIQVGGEEVFNTLISRGYKISTSFETSPGYCYCLDGYLVYASFSRWKDSDLEEITFAEALKLIDEQQKVVNKKPLPKFIVDALSSPVAHKVVMYDDEYSVIDVLIGIDYDSYAPWMGLNNEYPIIAPYKYNYKTDGTITGINAKDLKDFLSLEESIKYYEANKGSGFAI